MVQGITNRVKQYVEVIVRCDEDGNETPLAIIWRDGMKYKVDRVLEKMPRAAMKVGGHGMCYTVQIGGKVTRIWRDTAGWFVEEKVNHGITSM